MKLLNLAALPGITKSVLICCCCFLFFAGFFFIYQQNNPLKDLLIAIFSVFVFWLYAEEKVYIAICVTCFSITIKKYSALMFIYIMPQNNLPDFHTPCNFNLKYVCLQIIYTENASDPVKFCLILKDYLICSLKREVFGVIKKNFV